jgi:hypothetical protein
MRKILIITSLLLFLYGCNELVHVSAEEFKWQYDNRHMQSIFWADYLGEKDGKVYLFRKRAPLIGSKWKEEVLFTEVDSLDADFLNRLRKQEKLTTQNNDNAARRKGGNLVFLVDAPATVRQLEPFKKLKRDSSVMDMIKLVGNPDDEAGSGIYILVYKLEDGTEVHIGAANLNESLMYIVHVSKDGKRENLFK